MAGKAGANECQVEGEKGAGRGKRGGTGEKGE